MRPRNDDGTYAAPPVEGSRYQLTLHGTQTTTSNFNTNFSGNGNILPQGSKTLRIAVLHSYSQTTDKNRSESELKYTPRPPVARRSWPPPATGSITSRA